MSTNEKVKHPQIIRDLMTLVFKIDNQENLRPDQKIAKLKELSQKFRTGWPFGLRKDGTMIQLSEYGQNAALSEYRNLLECFAAATADRIHRIELVRWGRDIGKLDTKPSEAPKVTSTQ
jgi:hypothetical protein